MLPGSSENIRIDGDGRRMRSDWQFLCITANADVQQHLHSKGLQEISLFSISNGLDVIMKKILYAYIDFSLLWKGFLPTVEHGLGEMNE